MSKELKLTIPAPNKSTRLHLYVASACPFCHRVIAALELTGLSGNVGYTWMENVKEVEGWAIDPDAEPAFNESYLASVYERLDPKAIYRPSVPLLVDLSTKSILSTSSSEMTHYFSSGMDGAHELSVDLYPTDLSDEIDKLNEWLHESINRAVYLAGFSRDQADYESKVKAVFSALDEMESRLSKQTYLFGKTITESDLYLFATLVRFDEIYFPLFKCSYRLIKDYSALSAYLNKLLSIPELRDTVNLRSFKEHYYKSVMHVGDNPLSLNPMGTVPVGMFKE
ncbi:glutathione S-transferase C-terminal domain-containing protein [Amphritea japonica]|uniref:Glutathione S-transferase n=1 Tax=Amphritea japonica ATCC BAA-1530 TaxID=1278309 RepID=A0A7R6P3T2_9GAMM|nr:glutathione S-transferase C-terminal domain-containing protein [Amphritea japonica]BBB26703.1 glutathione S-transferase [Amphritea japonica ATCC BAA-1530]